jgi:hypothetical protein
VIGMRVMDYSTDFKSQRALLNEQVGGTYRAFVQSLVPRYGVVWYDIAFGYLMLVLTAGQCAHSPTSASGSARSASGMAPPRYWRCGLIGAPA